jgi:hypothetical protein
VACHEFTSHVEKKRVEEKYQSNHLFFFWKIFHKNRAFLWGLHNLISSAHHHHFLSLEKCLSGYTIIYIMLHKNKSCVVAK